MFLWLFIIASSQLWWAVTCPPSHSHGHDCNLAGKDSLTSTYKVLVKNNNRRQFQMELSTKREKAVLKTGEEKVNLTNKVEKVPEPLRQAAKGVVKPAEVKKVVDDPTKFYWNRTSERCDYERIRCMRAYATGAVCARTLFYQYYSFPNYCALDFHNCVGRYGFWQLAYMGICTEIDIAKHLYVELSYDQMANYTFLTQMYTADSGDITM